MKRVTIILPTYCPSAEVEEYLELSSTLLDARTDWRLANLVVVEQGKLCYGAFPHQLLGPFGLHIYNEKPLGYAKAVNIGFKAAIELGSEYVCVTSNDVFVPPGWLELLIRDFESIPNCGVLAPLDGPTMSTDPAAGIVSKDDHWGALYLTKRSIIEQAGLLDEDKLNMRFCDQDQSIRIKKLGLEICRTASVTVEHINSATYSKMGVDEEPEKAVMMERWGCLHFHEWVERNRK